MKKLGAVSVPHLKSTAGEVPEAIPVPSNVKLLMSVGFGAPATPVVNVGDQVKVGQPIAQAEASFSSPVHASVSGTVKSIDGYDELTGEKSVSVTITADGEQTPWEGISPVRVTNLAEFLGAVKDSGVVGLGGSGYPTASKLAAKEPGKLDYILINGMECEPYITSDTRTMIDDAQSVWEGVLLLKEHLAPKNIVICTADNKPEPIKKMQALSAGVAGVEVRALPSLYPMGAEMVLARSVTGRIAPEGGCLADVGCIVLNCTTVATFAKYIKTGHPLTAKCVSVDGSAVETPKNVIAPIGTPVGDLLGYCGVFDGFILDLDVGKVILGGPMRGVAIPNLDIPITKTTNALLAFKKKDCAVPDPSPCIKCSRCIEICPMNLMPPYFERAFELKKPDLLEQFKVHMCIQCGCCAYTCPAKRPLVQVMALSKNILRDYKAAHKLTQEKEA